MENKIELNQEELEMIGRHRWKQEHMKNTGKITILCFVIATILGVVIYKTIPGTLYVLGLLPVFIPTYLNMRLDSQAKKAGIEFANGLLKQKALSLT